MDEKLFYLGVKIKTGKRAVKNLSVIQEKNIAS